MRSKETHVVNFVYEVTQPNNPKQGLLGNPAGWGMQADLSVQLSQKLGRNVKQGQNFRVTGWGASVIPKSSGVELDPEEGLSVSMRASYIPTTYHSAQAWRLMNKHYWKQSNFRKGLSVTNKNDEFEIAISKDHLDSNQNFNADRTSKIYVGGVNDPTPEAVLAYGEYDDEDGIGDGSIGLDTFYDAKFPITDPAVLVETDLLFDDAIQSKPHKFRSRFPKMAQIWANSTLASNAFYDHDILLDDIYQTGGHGNVEYHMLPADNHLNVMAGLFDIQLYGMSPDDENKLADGAFVIVSFLVEGWSSLSSKPKKKSRRKLSYRKSSKRGRRYGKRRG